MKGKQIKKLDILTFLVVAIRLGGPKLQNHSNAQNHLSRWLHVSNFQWPPSSLFNHIHLSIPLSTPFDLILLSTPFDLIPPSESAESTARGTIPLPIPPTIKNPSPRMRCWRSPGMAPSSWGSPLHISARRWMFKLPLGLRSSLRMCPVQFLARLSLKRLRRIFGGPTSSQVRDSLFIYFFNMESFRVLTFFWNEDCLVELKLFLVSYYLVCSFGGVVEVWRWEIRITSVELEWWSNFFNL